MKDLNYLNHYRQDLRNIYGTLGDDHNGVFKVYIGGRAFHAVASNGGGWEHVSVSPGSRSRKTCPTWEEMCEIKKMFFNDDECVLEYHPAQSDYVNLCDTCLHLWRPINQEIPMPPSMFV